MKSETFMNSLMSSYFYIKDYKLYNNLTKRNKLISEYCSKDENLTE